jgi:hypothetical protein
MVNNQKINRQIMDFSGFNVEKHILKVVKFKLPAFSPAKSKP